MSQETIFEYTKIDPWFLSQLGELHEAELWLKTQSLDSISYDDLLATKQRGFSDVQIARCMGKASPPPLFTLSDFVHAACYLIAICADDPNGLKHIQLIGSMPCHVHKDLASQKLPASQLLGPNC